MIHSLIEEPRQPPNLLIAFQSHRVPLDQSFGAQGLFIETDARGVPLGSANNTIQMSLHRTQFIAMVDEELDTERD
jgi:hypothetical protein